MWMWNEKPELRYLFFSTFNDLKQVEKIIGNIGNKKRRIILAHMKSLGMVKGVLDFIFYYNNVLHVIDFKVGSDSLSKEQKEFIAQVERQGGKSYEIRTLEEFQKVVEKIIKQ
jgi:ATP-dependent exoDNAse (exonuclease V) beta subunit